MRSLMRLFGLAFLILCIVLGILINRTTPVANLETTSTPAFTQRQTYYIKSDAPIAGYECPDIECAVAAIIPGGSAVTVIGTARGEAMIPIQYQSQAVLYVVDNWLSAKSVSVSDPLRPRGGASAICKDGWVSYSANRRGTCSHHGGVRKWYSPK